MPDHSGLLADLRRAYDALACANLGEYMPQHKQDALLRFTGGVTSSDPELVPRTHARVALAVQGQIQPGALYYARSACERMDADLDIVTDLAEGGLQAALDPERQRLAESGHRIEIIRLGRDILRGVVNYAKTRRGLLFVVVSAEDAVADRVTAGTRDSRFLDVPWVVVASASIP